MADGILPQSTTPTADPSILPGQQLTPAVPAGQQSGVVAQAAAPAPQVPPATEFSDDMMHSLKNLAMVGALTGNEKLVGSLHFAVEMMKTDSFTGRMEAGGKVLEQMQRAGAGREAIEAFGKKYSFDLLGSNINVYKQGSPEAAKKEYRTLSQGQSIVDMSTGEEVASKAAKPDKPDKPVIDHYEKEVRGRKYRVTTSDGEETSRDDIGPAPRRGGGGKSEKPLTRAEIIDLKDKKEKELTDLRLSPDEKSNRLKVYVGALTGITPKPNNKTVRPPNGNTKKSSRKKRAGATGRW